MNKKYITMLVLTSVLFVGCGFEKNDVLFTETSSISKSKTNNSLDTIKEFNSLMLLNPTERELINYIDENITSTSENYADKMILDFEKTHNSKVDTRTLSLYRDNIQDMIIDEFAKSGVVVIYDKKELKDMENIGLKEYLSTYLDIGYMLKKSESGYKLGINYKFYSRYKPYVSDEIDMYIDIMTTETSDPVLVDGTINITWDQVFQRILAYEKFMYLYGESNRYEVVENIYNEYVKIYIVGTDITPAFLNDLTLRNYLRQSYDNVYIDNLDSKFVAELRKYLNVLEKEEYRYTNEVKEGQDKILPNLKVGEFN